MSWDEFSHWGDVVKMMHSYNVLSTSQVSGSAFQSYPPGQSILLYIAQVLNGSFNESLLFMVQQFSICAFLLSIVDLMRIKKRIYSVVLIFCLILFPAVFFGSFFSSILIDQVIAIVFATGVLIIILEMNDTLLLLVTSLFALFLFMIKDSGKVFAFFLILAYFIKYNQVNRNNLNIKKILIRSLILLIPSLMFYFSWKYSIDVNQASVSFSSPIDIKTLLQSLLLSSNSYRDEVVINFFTAMRSSSIFNVFGIDFSVATLTLVVLAVYIYFQQKCKRFSSIILFGLGAFYIYYFGLLVSYLFKFSSYEALKLASYTRYVNVGVMGLLIVLVFGIVFSETKLRNLRVCVISLCIALTTTNAPIDFISAYSDKSVSQNTRSQYNTITEKSFQILPSERSNVFILSTKTTGFDYWVIRFAIRPLINKTNEHMFSIGKKSNQYDDVWTRELSTSEFSNILKEYDYLLIYKADLDFIEMYSELFASVDDIENNSVFKIEKYMDSIKLQLLG